jgi:hypothetical protein
VHWSGYDATALDPDVTAGGCINCFFERRIEYVNTKEGTKKGRPGGVQGGPLVQILDHQRAQQAAGDAAKKATLAARNLVDATKEAEEASIAAVAAAALSAPEEAQVSLRGSTATVACCSACMYLTVTAAC